MRWPCGGRAEDGVVYATNHFVSPEMFYPENKDPNTYARFERLGELATLHHSAFDLEQTVAVLRDRYDVHAGRETFGGDIIATPSNMLSVVFCPSDLTFWVANGPAPAAYREFVAFSLPDELDGMQAHTSVPSMPADPIVGSAAWAEVEAFQAGYLAYLQGDDATAAKRLAEAVSLNPHSARYGYYLGRALTNLDREEEAITAFKSALAGDPHSGYCAYIYYRLGLIYEEMGAEEEMRAAFEQVLALDIGDEDIEGYARRALGR
jgi:tetratricopeptide (TPR) repeat protein